MDKFMEFGITLTFLLICISVFYTIGTNLGITQTSSVTFPDQYSSDDLNTLARTQPIEGSSSAHSAPTTVGEWLNYAMRAIGGAFTLLFMLVFGWTTMIVSMLDVVGLGVAVGYPLVGIFGFVQILTLIEVIRRLISAVRGAVP